MGMSTGDRRTWADIRSAKIASEQEAAAAAGVRALRDALNLRGLRKDAGMTQAQLAQRLGKSQGNVSELERREDVYLSSLREYVEALGGRLKVSAAFGSREVPIYGNIGSESRVGPEPHLTKGRSAIVQARAARSR